MRLFHFIQVPPLFQHDKRIVHITADGSHRADMPKFRITAAPGCHSLTAAAKDHHIRGQHPDHFHLFAGRRIIRTNISDRNVRAIGASGHRRNRRRRWRCHPRTHPQLCHIRPRLGDRRKRIGDLRKSVIRCLHGPFFQRRGHMCGNGIHMNDRNFRNRSRRGSGDRSIAAHQNNRKKQGSCIRAKSQRDIDFFHESRLLI
nr:MAG TPA: hypothetical protein [Caudoviricetes sp.]